MTGKMRGEKRGEKRNPKAERRETEMRDPQGEGKRNPQTGKTESPKQRK